MCRDQICLHGGNKTREGWLCRRWRAREGSGTREGRRVSPNTEAEAVALGKEEVTVVGGLGVAVVFTALLLRVYARGRKQRGKKAVPTEPPVQKV